MAESIFTTGFGISAYTINTGSKPSTRPISNRLLGYNTTVTQFFYLWKIMMMVTATNTDAFHVLGAVPRASHVLFASIFLTESPWGLPMKKRRHREGKHFPDRKWQGHDLNQGRLILKPAILRFSQCCLTWLKEGHYYYLIVLERWKYPLHE